ncbi:Arc family DNA-binding protein [Pseudochrobactrum sp. sp1633]|uniref:Arc family DNA-binding protein n=1 Tax=Pseudochrobactrum sp. sp1633 TaxID=3036706 RepID=UPI0025A5A2F0|nr:Arc family DNA-binding protein [Pseudochrobactrum sp. sp1633]MDM8346456.1 Arc family DNA-binding protein [Pseudochrobactrum sp. sp1633]
MSEVRMTVRLPKEVADFLGMEAKDNYTSRNAEIVRSVKQRMRAIENEKAGSPLTA